MILAFSDEEDNILNAITRALADKTEILSVEPEELFSLAFIGIEIFPKERKVKIGRKEVKFSRFEFDILLFLAKHPRQVFTRKQIYEAVWDDIPVSVDAKVECMIYSIRKKLRAYTDRKYIRTVWGVGYKFDPET